MTLSGNLHRGPREKTFGQEHPEADFSHGICPDCARELYQELYDEERGGSGV